MVTRSIEFVFYVLLLFVLTVRFSFLTQITVISQFRVHHWHENLTSIIVDGAQEHLSELGFAVNDYRSKKDQYVNEELINTVYETTALMNYTLGYPSVQELIKGPAIFDLLLIDSYFSDSLLG